MKTVVTDNTCNADMRRVITWQYDHADNLVSTVMMFKYFFVQSTELLWNAWHGKVVNIDTADDFGLSVWGKVLGCQRPNVTVGATTSPLSTSVYRALLKARFALMSSKGAASDYVAYVTSVFGGHVKVADGNNMSLSFVKDAGLSGELLSLFNDCYDSVFVFPAGVKDNTSVTGGVLAFDGQQKTAASDPITNTLGYCYFNS